jgi:hypothetical protein
LRILQARRSDAPAKSQVVACEGRDGSLAIEHRGRALRWQEIPALGRKPGDLQARAGAPARSAKAKGGCNLVPFQLIPTNSRKPRSVLMTYNSEAKYTAP